MVAESYPGAVDRLALVARRPESSSRLPAQAPSMWKPSRPLQRACTWEKTLSTAQVPACLVGVRQVDAVAEVSGHRQAARSGCRRRGAGRSRRRGCPRPRRRGRHCPSPGRPWSGRRKRCSVSVQAFEDAVPRPVHRQAVEEAVPRFEALDVDARRSRAPS